MKAHRLVGAEFLAGIPGTLGGAVTMNAGTKNGECMRVVDAVELATADGIGWVPRARLPFRYRHTELPAGGVVTRVRFGFRDGDVEPRARRWRRTSATASAPSRSASRTSAASSRTRRATTPAG